MSSKTSAATTTTTTTTITRSTSIVSSSLSPAAKTHTIQVGPKEGPHQYVPHELEANVGDLIVFEFYPRNHSVVQADWKAPCIPADGDYFFSGIKNDFEEVNGQVVGTVPTWNWTVERAEPTFFYCTATDSCIVNGMVGVINPNSTRTWESQTKAALEAPYMLLPGEPMPAEGEATGTGTTATHSSPFSTSPSTDSAQSIPSTSTSSSNGISAGAIAGIVIGSVASVIILCVLLFVLGRNHVYKKWLSHSHEGSSSKDVRTAQWALSTSAIGTGVGKSEGDAGSTRFPGHLSVPRASLINEPGIGPGPHTGTGPGYFSTEQGLPHTLSGIYSAPEASGYGGSPLGSQIQGQQGQPGQQQQQQQQPYWIWDQSIQPHHLAGRRGGGPLELEAEAFK